MDRNTISIRIRIQNFFLFESTALVYSINNKSCFFFQYVFFVFQTMDEDDIDGDPVDEFRYMNPDIDNHPGKLTP